MRSQKVEPALRNGGMMGRILLFAAAVLLVATAAIHASGQAMVESWTQGFDDQQAAAVRLVWITDSIDWAVVAVLWGLAGWRQERGWLGAGAVATLVPLAGGIGVTSIDYTFFGGWMLLDSVALAVAGLVFSWRT
ncbi:MAG: hypothetical protein LC648_09370 [Novosphingobium sp.]|nr:hypothetical protein [Novosphingobium sp.]